MNKDYKKCLDVLEEGLKCELQTVWIETSEWLPKFSDKCIVYRVDRSGNDEYKLAFWGGGVNGECWVDTDAYMYNKDYFSHWTTITKPQENKKNGGCKQTIITIQYYQGLLKKIENVLIDWTKESSNETERLSFLKVFDYIQELKTKK